MPASPTASLSSARAAADVLRAEARRLHRTLTSGPLSAALPVLRRLQRAGLLPATGLPALYAARAQVQRKLLLRLLATEHGFASWERCLAALQGQDAQTLARQFEIERGTAELKLWFASPAEAQAHARVHGGVAVEVRGQAVVLAGGVGA